MAKRNLEIELLTSHAAFVRALKRAGYFFDAPPKTGSPEDAEFEVLMLMVEKYERGHFPVPPPDPVAAIRFALEQRGMQPADLQQVLGSRQRAHDVMRKKRHLTLPQIRSLNEKLRVPAEVLIRDYALA